MRLHCGEMTVLAAVGLVLAGGVLAGTFAFSDLLIDGKFEMLPCMYRTLFAKECLTCGMTRSFAAMWKANLPLAVSFNRGGPLLYCLLWSLFMLCGGIIIYGRFVRLRRMRWER